MSIETLATICIVLGVICFVLLAVLLSIPTFIAMKAEKERANLNSSILPKRKVVVVEKVISDGNDYRRRVE